MPILFQARAAGAEAWRTLGVLNALTAASVALIEGHGDAVRFVDTASGGVLAKSRSAPKNRLPPGIERVRVLHLARDTELEQREIDPYATFPKRVHVKRPVHRAHSVDGW